MKDDDQTSPIPDSAKMEERLLVAVSPSISSEQLVRWAQRLAKSLNCWWGAVYVEIPVHLAEEDQLQLARTLALARSLGAEVITTSEPDVVDGLLKTALQHHVTQIIIGKPVGSAYRRLFRSDKWLDRLLRESGQIDIHVVRFNAGPPSQEDPPRNLASGSTLREYLIAVTMILFVSWVSRYIEPVVGYRAIAWIFLAIVVAMATFVGRGATLLAAVLSALLWDFLYEQPSYSLYIERVEDRILFVMYLAIAVTLGQLVARLRAQEIAERERQEYATALQLLTREVSAATSFDDLLKRAVHQTEAIFKAEIGILLPVSPARLVLHPDSSFKVPVPEYAVANRVLEYGHAAGKFTAESPTASAWYVPLAAHRDTVGVMGLKWSTSTPPTIHQRNLLDAFSQQIAVAIQRHQMQQVEEKSRLLAESERLSKTLLNSISHEIRTPLAIIQSATTNMTEYGHAALSDSQRMMVAEIQEASDRLNRLIGRVLDMTRLESGHLKPQFEDCEASELVLMAEGETRRELAQHKLAIDLVPDLPLIRMDFEFMLHALNNLLSNAAFHTPPGTEVHLSVKVEEGAMLFVVADKGPGIPPESIPHLFEKFYRAPNARTGGTGLGLSLVKGFVEAHGGQVTVKNRVTGGTAFTIRLPL